MPYPPRPSLTGDPLAHLAANARLTLTEDRAADVAAMVDGVNALIDVIDQVDLGETPPATAFDARWE